MGNQPDSNHGFNEILLERLWSAYELVDKNRQKAFYYLYIGTTIFAYSLWTDREVILKLSFMGALPVC